MVSDAPVINCNHVLKPETINVPHNLNSLKSARLLVRGGWDGFKLKQNNPVCIYLYFSLIT